VDFLSHAAIVGFMGGAATVVCLQQLKSILGLEHFTHEADIVSVMKSVFTQTREVQLVETLQLDSYFVLLLRDTSVVFFIH
jgi:sulfate transporter 3